MQINKKLYTTLMITLLALSTIAVALPLVHAISTTPPELRAAANPPGAIITGSAVGGKVSVVGVAGGAGEANPFSTVTLYWDGLSGKVLGTVDAAADGSWVLNVTIPSATEGTHYIVATDGSGNVGAPIDVTTSLQVGGFGPTRALPGDSVVITGHGYAPNSAVTVTLDSTTLATPVSITLTSPAITTNGTGSFSATIVVPTTMAVADYDTYDVTAEDASANSDDDSLIIDYYIILTPGSGPTGITTTISGRIPASTAYELRFNGAAITTGTSASDGTFSFAYTIPGVLSPAGYAVDVVWATVNIKTNTFTVSSSPTIATGVAHAVSGTTVTLTGSGFSGMAGITLRFDTTTVNSTTDDARFGPTTFFGGNIPAGTTFVVPTLAPGIYAVTVVDQYGATSATGVFFTIDPTPVFTANTRATNYVQGNVISIYTYSTSNPAVYMVISDPNGMYLCSVNILGTAWADMGAYYSIPTAAYALETVTLPADAPVGTWNFTFYETSAMTDILDTNLFTVSAPATLDSVMDGIDEVKDTLDDMTDMISDIDGNVVTIKGDVTNVKNLVSALDISVLSSDLNSIQMDVADLKATVTSVSDDVATVQTTLGTLEGTITSINGNTATIDTAVGTLQADITDIKGSVDNMPAWIAVVLALVAAVAAIFAVITIRQKIAG